MSSLGPTRLQSISDVGVITASTGDVIVKPIRGYPSGQMTGIINVHGYGSVASTTQDSPNIGVGIYPGVTSDLGISGTTPGGTNGWGNDTMLNGITDCYNYLTGTMGCKSKVFLIGTSMGCMTALSWAWHNPTKVSAMFVQLSVVDLTGIWTNNISSFTTPINQAYGGTYHPTNTDATYTSLTVEQARSPLAQALHDPSPWANIPITMWWGGADPIALPPQTVQFISLVPSVIGVQDIGRTDAGATYASGSSTVNDTSITAGDAGLLVTSTTSPYTNIPYPAYVSNVVANSHFTLYNNSTGTGGAAVNAAANGTSVIIGGGTHTTTVVDLTPTYAQSVLNFFETYA